MGTHRRKEFEGGWLVAALFIVCVAFAGHSKAEGLRLEATVGLSQHHLAPEGTWWYQGFDTKTHLKAGGFSIGASWMPIEYGRYRFGLRGGYADLGRITAENSFPIVEDGSINDARVNSTCDRATLSGCTGKFKGAGWTNGWYFGPALERDFAGLTLGADAGVFYYRSAWVTHDFRAEDSQGEFIPQGWGDMQWEVDAWHATWYGSANLRWKNLFVYGRRYAQVHAADTARSAQSIGMTSGPVWSVMAGLSVPL